MRHFAACDVIFHSGVGFDERPPYAAVGACPCSVRDPLARIWSGFAGGDDDRETCPVERSAIGMADGRQHDLNADERMRPTTHNGASVQRPVCCGREGHHNVQVDVNAGLGVGRPTRDRARSRRARGSAAATPRFRPTQATCG